MDRIWCCGGASGLMNCALSWLPASTHITLQLNGSNWYAEHVAQGTVSNIRDGQNVTVLVVCRLLVHFVFGAHIECVMGDCLLTPPKLLSLSLFDFNPLEYHFNNVNETDFMFCWPYILIYSYNKPTWCTVYPLFILSITSTCFGYIITYHQQVSLYIYNDWYVVICNVQLTVC
jgi:hypothetical protein